MLDEVLLRRTTDLTLRYLSGLPERRVGALEDAAALVRRIGRPLPDDGENPLAVIERLVTDVEPGLVSSAGPRFFGFVFGGVPVALAADWLTAAWDQNAALHAGAGRPRRGGGRRRMDERAPRPTGGGQLRFPDGCGAR